MNFRGALHRGVKIIPGRCILRMISCVRIWTHLLFSKKKKYLAVLILFMGIICWTISILGYLNSSYFIQIAKNLLRSWFVDGAHMLNHIITPRNQQNSTFFHYISLWIRFFLHRFLRFVIIFMLHKIVKIDIPHDNFFLLLHIIHPFLFKLLQHQGDLTISGRANLPFFGTDLLWYIFDCQFWKIVLILLQQWREDCILIGIRSKPFVDRYPYIGVLLPG